MDCPCFDFVAVGLVVDGLVTRTKLKSLVILRVKNIVERFALF